jgi:hypothetical protein
MRITCEIEEIELDGNSKPIPSVQATCSRCDHVTESYGTSEASVRRCLAVMREECPCGQTNYYVADGGDDND